MRITGYPHCCTTDIVYALGASANQSYEIRGGNHVAGDIQGVYLKLREYMSLVRSRAMITAVCTDQQQEFVKVARALGWRFGPWAKSKAHPTTKTRLCYWLVQDGIPEDVTVRNKLGLTVA